MFLALAALVVVPLYVLLDWLAYGGRDPEGWLDLASAVEHLVVIPALVTAMHVVAVQDLGRGEQPRIGRSASAALSLAPKLVLVVTAYTLLVTLGLFALILPGIIAAVRLYFGAQSVVVDRAGVYDALHNSGELTGEGRWVRTLVVLVLLSAVGWAVNYAVSPVYENLDGGLWVPLAIVERSLLVSFTALVGTLLFFDLRARRGDPEPSPPRDVTRWE